MQASFHRIWFIFLVTSLTACIRLPERSPELAASSFPRHWQAKGDLDQAVPLHWLATFDDPLLTQTVQTAVANNFDLKAASARIDAAVAQVRIDGSGRLPQLSFRPGYEYVRASRVIDDSGEFKAFGAFFDLSWELDVWGRIRAGQLASMRDADTVEADYRAARLSLAARTAQTYIELAEARAQVKVAEQSMQDRRTLVELLRGRFRRGLTHALDLRLALTDLANAEAQLAEQRTRVQNLDRSLEVLLGRYPSGRFRHAAYLPKLPPDVPAGLPSQLLDRRPDLNAEYNRLLATDQRLDSARKALLPRVTLTANGGTTSSALTELIDPRAAAWNLGLGLLQPLYAGGRLTGDISLQKARVEEALNRYRDTVLNAFREVEQTLAAEGRLREQARALQEAVRQTDASRKLAVYSYRHGLIEILTLLDSYRSTLSAQSSQLTAQRQLLNNRIDLYLALGGSY